MMKKTYLILILTTLFMSFLAHAEKLNMGTWRFELRSTHAAIPFNITLHKNKDHLSGVLHNGKETIKLNDIVLKKNELLIPLQTYEMTLEMNIEDKNTMMGFLVRHNKNPKVKTPVIALHGDQKRFPPPKYAPKIDLNGRWSVLLTEEDNKTSEGVLVFEQKGSDLYGSLLTPTGDYRYFEGYVSGIDFEAASFDGMYNYLIKGTVKDGRLDAAIRAHYITKISGKHNPKAELPDAYKQTQLEKMDFSFPDLQGKMVSLKDARFKGKPVIVQFFGSWCPNCMDEMNFLIPWYKNNKQRGIELVALAFERSVGDKEAKIQLKKTVQKKRIPYPLLVAGTTASDKPMDKIQGLKNFISFPTTVFLNKKHEVVKVHAGFTGPSTGEFYEKWKSEFAQTVSELLK